MAGGAREREAPAIAGAVHAIEPLGRETLFHVRAESLDLLVLSDERPYALGEAVRAGFDWLGFAPDPELPGARLADFDPA